MLSDGCTVMCLAMISVGVKLEVALVNIRCLVYEKTRAVECCSIAEKMNESGKWKVFKNEEAKKHHVTFPRVLIRSRSTTVLRSNAVHPAQ